MATRIEHEENLDHARGHRSTRETILELSPEEAADLIITLTQQLARVGGGAAARLGTAESGGARPRDLVLYVRHPERPV